MEVFRKSLFRQQQLTFFLQFQPYKSFHESSRSWSSFVLPILQASSATPTLCRSSTISHNNNKNNSRHNVNLPNIYGMNSLGGVRMKSMRWNNKVAKLEPGGVHYPGFTYFPRPGEVDPPYEPSKLFMVKKRRSLRAKPWWDKQIMHALQLKEGAAVTIVKNTPTMCAQLYKIKHLVEIVPITFPNGFPKDIGSGFIKENGEFISYTQIGAKTSQDLDEQKKHFDECRKKSFDALTLKKRLHSRWYSRWD